MKRPFRVLISAITLVFFFAGTMLQEAAWAFPVPFQGEAGHLDSYAPEHISPVHGAEGIILPRDLGTIQARYDREGSGRVLFHIQEAHCNYSCQKKIAEIIGYLRSEYGVGVVNLEGGAGEYELGVFTEIEDPNTRQAVADSFMRRGMLNGAEYFAINNPGDIDLWGVEDPALYRSNLDVYRRSLVFRDKGTKHIGQIRNALESVKPYVYPEKLLELDGLRKVFEEGSAELGEYLPLLISMSGLSRETLSAEFPDLALLAEALKIESDLDFQKAEDERDSFIERVRVYSPWMSLKELASRITGLHEGRVSKGAFYGYIVKMALQSGVCISGYPEFERYLRYVELYEGMDKIRAMEEKSALWERARHVLSDSPEARQLGELCRDLGILEGLFSLRLMHSEYADHLSRPEDFRAGNFVSFIRGHAVDPGTVATLDEGVYDLDSFRKTMVRFYGYTLERDRAFIRNLRTGRLACRAGDKGLEGAILVTGGFHTANLTEMLKEEGISFISILPSYEETPGASDPYFKLLAGEYDIQSKNRFAGRGMALAVASYLNAADLAGRGPAGDLKFLMDVLRERAIHGRGAVDVMHGGRMILRIDPDGRITAASGREAGTGVRVDLSEMITGLCSETVLKLLADEGVAGFDGLDVPVADFDVSGKARRERRARRGKDPYTPYNIVDRFRREGKVEWSQIDDTVFWGAVESLLEAVAATEGKEVRSLGADDLMQPRIVCDDGRARSLKGLIQRMERNSNIGMADILEEIARNTSAVFWEKGEGREAWREVALGLGMDEADDPRDSVVELLSRSDHRMTKDELAVLSRLIDNGRGNRAAHTALITAHYRVIKAYINTRPAKRGLGPVIKRNAPGDAKLWQQLDFMLNRAGVYFDVETGESFVALLYTLFDPILIRYAKGSARKQVNMSGSSGDWAASRDPERSWPRRIERMDRVIDTVLRVFGYPPGTRNLILRAMVDHDAKVVTGTTYEDIAKSVGLGGRQSVSHHVVRARELMREYEPLIRAALKGEMSVRELGKSIGRREALKREAKKASRAETRGKVQELLHRSRIRRPEPEELEEIPFDKLKSALLRIWNNERIPGKGSDAIKQILASETFGELDRLLPYLSEMVEAIRKDHDAYELILIVDRDAAMLYDALKTAFHETPLEKKVVLFPGSMEMMENLNEAASDGRMGPGKLRAFLEKYGIRESIFRNGDERILAIDTGFYGHFGELLVNIMEKAFGPGLSEEAIGQSVDMRFVSTTPQAGQYFSNVGPLVQPGTDQAGAEEAFPKTAQVLRSRFEGFDGQGHNFYLAVAMQLMPHYHGAYERLDPDSLAALPSDQAGGLASVTRYDIDDARGPNDSVVNPFAAMLVQKRVVDHFRDMRDGSARGKETMPGDREERSTSKGWGRIPLLRKALVEARAEKHQAFLEQLAFWSLNALLFALPGIGPLSAATLTWSAFMLAHYALPAEGTPAPSFWRVLGISSSNWLFATVSFSCVYLGAPFLLAGVGTGFVLSSVIHVWAELESADTYSKKKIRELLAREQTVVMAEDGEEFTFLLTPPPQPHSRSEGSFSIITLCEKGERADYVDITNYTLQEGFYRLPGDTPTAPLYVRDDHRGRGIATSLLTFAMAVALEEGRDGLRLHSPDINLMTFYESMGFLPVSEYPGGRRYERLLGEMALPRIEIKGRHPAGRTWLDEPIERAERYSLREVLLHMWRSSVWAYREAFALIAVVVPGVRHYRGTRAEKTRASPSVDQVNHDDIRHFLAVVEDDLFRELGRIRRKAPAGSFEKYGCFIASHILIRLVADRFGIPEGGHEAVRVELFPGHHKSEGLGTLHQWVTLHTGDNTTPVHIDAAYGQFDDEFRDRLLVMTTPEDLAERNLRSMDELLKETVGNHFPDGSSSPPVENLAGMFEQGHPVLSLYSHHEDMQRVRLEGRSVQPLGHELESLIDNAVTRIKRGSSRVPRTRRPAGIAEFWGERFEGLSGWRAVLWGSLAGAAEELYYTGLFVHGAAWAGSILLALLGGPSLAGVLIGVVAGTCLSIWLFREDHSSAVIKLVQGRLTRRFPTPGEERHLLKISLLARVPHALVFSALALLGASPLVGLAPLILISALHGVHNLTVVATGSESPLAMAKRKKKSNIPQYVTNALREMEALIEKDNDHEHAFLPVPVLEALRFTVSGEVPDTDIQRDISHLYNGTVDALQVAGVFQRENADKKTKGLALKERQVRTLGSFMTALYGLVNEGEVTDDLREIVLDAVLSLGDEGMRILSEADGGLNISTEEIGGMMGHILLSQDRFKEMIRLALNGISLEIRYALQPQSEPSNGIWLAILADAYKGLEDLPKAMFSYDFMARDENMPLWPRFLATAEFADLYSRVTIYEAGREKLERDLLWFERVLEEFMGFLENPEGTPIPVTWLPDAENDAGKKQSDMLRRSIIMLLLRLADMVPFEERKALCDRALAHADDMFFRDKADNRALRSYIEGRIFRVSPGRNSEQIRQDLLKLRATPKGQVYFVGQDTMTQEELSLLYELDAARLREVDFENAVPVFQGLKKRSEEMPRVLLCVLYDLVDLMARRWRVNLEAPEEAKAGLEDARTACIEFFAAMKKFRTRERDRHLHQMVTHAPGEQLNNALVMSRMIISDVKRWHEIEPGTLGEMTRFITRYNKRPSEGLLEELARALLDNPEEDALSRIFDQLGAVSSAFTEAYGPLGQRFYREIKHAVEDPALRSRMDDFLREQLPRHALTYDPEGEQDVLGDIRTRYEEVLILMTIQQALRHAYKGRKKKYLFSEVPEDEFMELLDSLLTAMGDRPDRLFKLIVSVYREQNYITRRFLPLPLLSYFAAGVMAERYVNYRPKTSEYKRMTEHVIELFKYLRGKEFQTLMKKYSDEVMLSQYMFYQSLGDMARHAGKDQLAVSYYERDRRIQVLLGLLPDSRSEFGRQFELPHLRALASLAVTLDSTMEVGRIAQADRAYEAWAEAAQLCLDAIVDDASIKGANSKDEIVTELLHSCRVIGYHLLLRAGRITPRVRGAAENVISTFAEYEVSYLNKPCNILAGWAHLLGMEEDFVSLVQESEAAGWDQDSPYLASIFMLNLGAISLEHSWEDLAGRAFEMARKFYAEVEVGHERSVLLAAEHLFRGAYDEAVDVISEAFERAEAVETGGLLEKYILLAIAHKLSGNDEPALAAISGGLERLAALQKSVPDRSKKGEATRTVKVAQLSSIMFLPHRMRSLAVSMLLSALLNNNGQPSLSPQATGIACDMIMGLIGEEEIDKLISHFEELPDNREDWKSPGAAARYGKLAELLVNTPSEKKRALAYVVLEEVVTRLGKEPSKSDRQMASSVSKAIKKAYGKVPDYLDPEETLLAAEYLFDRGQYDMCNSFVVRHGKENDELSELAQKTRDALALRKKIDTMYRDLDLVDTINKCNDLLDLNPRDKQARLISHNSALLESARQHVLHGEVQQALAALDLAHRDELVDRCKKGLTTFDREVKAATYALDENLYGEAIARLEKARGHKPLGLSLSRESTALSDLYILAGLQEKDFEGARDAFIDAEDISAAYNSVENMLQFPEKRRETFDLILRRSCEVFNGAASRDPATGMPVENTDIDEERDKVYKHAFELARLVYEFAEHKPGHRQLETAQRIISHAAANIWLPQLVNTYFTTKAVAISERERELEIRRKWGLPVRGKGDDRPIEIGFRNARLIRSDQCVKVGGFYAFGEQGPGEDVDIRDMDIRPGDHYALVIPDQSGKFFHKDPTGKDSINFEVQGFIQHRGESSFSLLFRMSGTPDEVKDMADLWEEARSNPKARLRRVRNSSWEKQAEMLKPLVGNLRAMTRTSLPVEGPEMRKITPASTMFPLMDRVMGIHLAQPTPERFAKINSVRAEKSELLQSTELDRVLDKEQTEAVLSAINSEIPVTYIQGPGGTGKTTVIVAICRLIAEHLKKPVRVLSQTNPAVDNIGKKLLQLEGIREYFARVGNNEEAVDEAMREVLHEKAQRLEKILDPQVETPNIVLGTLNGTHSDRVVVKLQRILKTFFVLIDETSRATVPETLWGIAMMDGVRSVTLVGDHNQLPAVGIKDTDVEGILKYLRGYETLISDFGTGPAEITRNVRTGIFSESNLAHFRISLLERVFRLFDNDRLTSSKEKFHFLPNQRRSGKYIVELNNYFYEGRLNPMIGTLPGLSDEDVWGVVIEDDYRGAYQEKRLPKVHAGGEYYEGLGEKGEKAGDIVNRGEVNRVISWLNWLINEEGLDPTVTGEIAVIAPYTRQVSFVQDAIKDIAALHSLLRDVERGVTVKKSRWGSVFNRIKDPNGAVLFRINDLHGAGGVRDFNETLGRLKGNPRPRTAKYIRERLGLGEKFICYSDVEENRADIVKTMDSSIGSEWKAVIYSWVRSNNEGNVGFLAGEIEGWRRRNVATARARKYSIHIWDGDRTFLGARSTEIQEWAAHNKDVFARAKAEESLPKNRLVLTKDGRVAPEGVPTGLASVFWGKCFVGLSGWRAGLWAGLAGGAEELFYSGLLVHGLLALAGSFGLGMQVSLAAIAAGTLMSIILFERHHGESVYKYHAGRLVRVKAEGEDRVRLRGMNITVRTLYAAGLAGVFLAGFSVLPTLPLIALLHAGWNIFVVAAGASFPLAMSPGKLAHTSVLAQKLANMDVPKEPVIKSIESIARQPVMGPGEIDDLFAVTILLAEREKDPSEFLTALNEIITEFRSTAEFRITLTVSFVLAEAGHDARRVLRLVPELLTVMATPAERTGTLQALSDLVEDGVSNEAIEFLISRSVGVEESASPFKVFIALKERTMRLNEMLGHEDAGLSDTFRALENLSGELESSDELLSAVDIGVVLADRNILPAGTFDALEGLLAALELPEERRKAFTVAGDLARRGISPEKMFLRLADIMPYFDAQCREAALETLGQISREGEGYLENFERTLDELSMEMGPKTLLDAFQASPQGFLTAVRVIDQIGIQDFSGRLLPFLGKKNVSQAFRADPASFAFALDSISRMGVERFFFSVSAFPGREAFSEVFAGNTMAACSLVDLMRKRGSETFFSEAIRIMAAGDLRGVFREDPAGLVLVLRKIEEKGPAGAESMLNRLKGQLGEDIVIKMQESNIIYAFRLDEALKSEVLPARVIIETERLLWSLEGVSELNPGSQQNLKQLILTEVFELHDSGKLAAQAMEALRRRISHRVLPAMRVIEHVYRKTPLRGGSAYLTVSGMSTPKKRKLQRLCQYLLSVPTSDIVHDLEAKKGKLEVMIHPGYLPMLLDNMIGYIEKDVMRWTRGKVEITKPGLRHEEGHLLPAYHTSIAGALGRDTVTLTVLGYMMGLPFKDPGNLIGSEFAPGEIGFLGAFVNDRCKETLTRGRTGGYPQTDLFSQLSAGLVVVRDEENVLLPGYPNDITLTTYLGCLYLADGPDQELVPEEVRAELQEILNGRGDGKGFRDKLKEYLRYIRLDDAAVELITGESYDMPEGVPKSYGFDRTQVLKAAAHLYRKFFRDIEEGEAVAMGLRGLLRDTVDRVRSTVLGLAPSLGDSIASFAEKGEYEKIIPVLEEAYFSDDERASLEAAELLGIARGSEAISLLLQKHDIRWLDGSELSQKDIIVRDITALQVTGPGRYCIVEGKKYALLEREENGNTYHTMIPVRDPVNIMGEEILVFEDVFPPVHPSSQALVQAVRPYLAFSGKDAMTVLDLGSGSGAAGLIAAGEKNVGYVTCADIDPRAVENTRWNAERRGKADRVEAFTSDLFSGLEGKRFDRILFNPPGLSSDRSRSRMELTRRFLEGLAGHLNEGGEALIVWPVEFYASPGDDNPVTLEALLDMADSLEKDNEGRVRFDVSREPFSRDPDGKYATHRVTVKDLREETEKALVGVRFALHEMLSLSAPDRRGFMVAAMEELLEANSVALVREGIDTLPSVSENEQRILDQGLRAALNTLGMKHVAPPYRNIVAQVAPEGKRGSVEPAARVLERQLRDFNGLAGRAVIREGDERAALNKAGYRDLIEATRSAMAEENDWGLLLIPLPREREARRQVRASFEKAAVEAGLRLDGDTTENIVVQYIIQERECDLLSQFLMGLMMIDHHRRRGRHYSAYNPALLSLISVLVETMEFEGAPLEEVGPKGILEKLFQGGILVMRPVSPLEMDFVRQIRIREAIDISL